MKASHGALRGGVDGVLGQAPGSRCHRAHVDDGSPAPAVVVAHAADGLPAAQDQPDDVDAEDPLDTCPLHVRHQPLVIDARVVDERVDRAELPVDRPEHRHDVLLAAHVGLDDQRSPPLGPDGRRHLVRALARAHVVDAYVVALPGRHLRDRRPDAATSPRHQEHAHPSRPSCLHETPRASRMPQSRYRAQSSRLVGSVTDAGRSRCNASSAARRPVASAPWTHSAPPSVARRLTGPEERRRGRSQVGPEVRAPDRLDADGAPRPRISRPVGHLEAHQLRADVGLREHLRRAPGAGARRRDQGVRSRRGPTRRRETRPGSVAPAGPRTTRGSRRTESRGRGSSGPFRSALPRTAGGTRRSA